jgi:hypothetical protein
MRPNTLVILLALGALTACQKETQELAQDAGLLPSTCGQAGARVQATIDGNSYCGNAQVLATGDEGSVMVTGIDLLGNTLVIQLDSLALGQQAITDATNGLLYMASGTPYVVEPGNPGTLTITQVDTSARTVKADFDAMLRNEMSGNARHVVGSLDVVYTN